MPETFREFLSTEGFLPHGHCYLWDPGVLWTHVISDLLIGLAYTGIPISLWYLLRRRRDIPFNSIVFLFGVFIVSCGLTHFMEVCTAWYPAYRLAGAVKVVTAVASVTTALQLVRFLPAAIALPNITQYQGMYEIAKESQASYRALLEASLDGFYILDTVRGAEGALVDFRVGDLNSAAAGQLGLPREAVVGRPLSDAAETGLLRPLLPTLLGVATTGTPVQRPYTSPDGRRHYVLQVAPLRDGVGVTLRDVTEQREAERRLRESEERYRLIVSQAPITFFAMDAGGTYLLADGRVYEGLGIDPKTLPGRAAEDVLGGVPQGAALVQRALRGEVVHGLVDWGHMVVKSHVSPVRDATGTVVGVTGVSVDVTDQVMAERELKTLTESLEKRVQERTAELQAVNEELQAFAYSVAHDLRSPLRAMDGFAQVLLSTEGDRLAPPSAAYLARIRANAQRMNDLIDGLLKLSRVTRADLVRQAVDLSALARAIVSELRHQHHGREVDVHIAEGLWTDGDLHLLRIALVNLLENAWKFTGTTPHARITFERVEHEGRIVFVMRDNGVGFSMDHADQLFGAFQRLHPREAFEGTGIGLATVKRIMARHGGEVWAESEPGKGASFYFTVGGGPNGGTRT